MNIAVIFAGGAGRRMKTDGVPKQFLEFRGKPIIIYTLELFENHSEIDHIVVACIADWIPYLQHQIEKFNIRKVKAVVPGGEKGQDSIRIALQAASEFAGEDAIVLIHDGVRPLIDHRTITENIRSVREFGSCITCVPATETFIINTDGRQYIPPRANSMIARAPQSFYLRQILDLQTKAYEAGKLDFIDCCSLMNYYGFPVHTMEGPAENIKITNPADFFIFKTLVDVKENQQIYGF